MPPKLRMERTKVSTGAGRLTQVAVPGPTAHLAGRHQAWMTESGCSVIVGREPAKANTSGLVLPESALMLWHLSIAHVDRYPTWDEIADVRYRLVPEDVTMAMLLPPPDEYVNAHEHCFHLWEIEDPRDPAVRGI